METSSSVAAASMPCESSRLLPGNERHLTRSKTEGSSVSPRPTGEMSALLQRIMCRPFGDQSGDKPSMLTTYEANSYRATDLSSWNTLFKVSGSVWARPSTYMVLVKMCGVSLIVGLSCLVLVPDPSELKISRLQSLSTFLNVFVGLLIGLFISSSLSRWYTCADGFLELFDSIRNLQIELYSLGVEDEKVEGILRYAVVSGWLLNMELAIEAASTDFEKQDIQNKMYQSFEQGERLVMFGGLTAIEREMLDQVGDPAAMAWVWVSCMIGDLAASGDVPPMSSPTYCRVMGRVTAAHAGIRKVRASISIQPPYIYVQMLAALVHFNNIINAAAFGLTWGATLGVVLLKRGVSIWGVTHNVPSEEVTRDVSSVLVAFLMSCFGPFIYHGLLEVSVAIARPFSSSDGAVPTNMLLCILEKDLRDGKMIKGGLQAPWKQASFKNPATPV